MTFPSLLKIPGFLIEFVTPIIKATKQAEQGFYTLPVRAGKSRGQGTGRGWNIDHYKGHDASTAETKEYFTGWTYKTFAWTTDSDGNLIDMAFRSASRIARRG